MEPQFVLNVGGLEKLKFSEKEFLELLDINLEKAISASEDLSCPKCKRTTKNAYFTFHKYEDFEFSKKDSDYTYQSTDYHLCICGCLYYLLHRSSRHAIKNI